MNVAHAFPSVPFAQTRARSSVASVILGRSRRILRPASSERMRSRAARSAKKAVVSFAAPTRSARSGKRLAPTPEVTASSAFCASVKRT